MIKVLVSACLLGERVRYDGVHALCASDVLAAWLREGRIVPFCPEVAGGFPVPRPPAQIAGGGGALLAILKDGSPSCGSSFIYDGRFTGTRKAKAGVTAALLESEGIRVFSERQIADAAHHLSRLEARSAEP